MLLQQIINAISLGGIYALLALGLAIVFSITGLINFAHGELMTLSGYGLLAACSSACRFCPPPRSRSPSALCRRSPWSASPSARCAAPA